MRQSWMKLVVWALSAVLVAASAAACGGPGEGDDGDPNNPPVTSAQGLRPTFQNGQSWTVATSYRSQGVRINELFKALTDELADPTPVTDGLPFVPDAIVPPSEELWSAPIFWTFGVITTDYTPAEDEDFYRYAVDKDGAVQPITILKVVADKDLNTGDIHETLDPVFYLVVRDADLRVRGVHYNYKVREGRNTVVLELPDNESELPAPGSDQPFFLVPYVLPAFPLDNTADAAHEVELADGGVQAVTPDGDAALASFALALDGTRVEQRWSEGQPWFDYSVTPTQRAWRLTPDQVVALGGTGSGAGFSTSAEFLEPAEAIATKFRNPIDLRAIERIEAGPIAASAPPSHIPWSGDYWSLKGGSAIFGWQSSRSGRQELTTGPATSLKATIRAEMESVDQLFATLIAMDRTKPEYDTKRDEYWEKKGAVQKKIDEHFDALAAKYRAGELTLTQEMVDDLGPLEKYDLYMMGNKLGGRDYKAWGASRWEMQNQWNPGGPGWWGHCNGWAAAAILTEQPTEPISVSVPLTNLTGQDGELTLEFAPGDLKALASLAYYTGYSHFYGERYNGTEQDIHDLHPHVFHRIVTYYIGQEKYPFVMDTTKDEEVWNFPAYAYDGQITEVAGYTPPADKPQYARAFDVEMQVIFGTDSVDQEYVATDIEAQEVYRQDYRYRLFTDASGKPLAGEWQSDVHPDFAWVPYGNNTSFGYRSNENPQLVVSVLEGLYEKRVNAPQVCEPSANGGAGDCPGDLVCNAVNGVCEEGAPQPGGACAGGARLDSAPALTAGTQEGLSICAGVESWFRVDLGVGDTLSATTTFRHADGDIDLKLVDDRGTTLAKSDSTSDTESLTFVSQAARTVYLGVFGYNGATNTVSLVVDLAVKEPGGCTEETNAANDSLETAQPLGASLEGGICGADADFFLVEGSGEKTVTLTFEHATGDLDMAALSPAGERLSVSESTANEEKVTGTAPFVVQVYGYNGAQAPYTLRVQ